MGQPTNFLFPGCQSIFCCTTIPIPTQITGATCFKPFVNGVQQVTSAGTPVGRFRIRTDGTLEGTGFFSGDGTTLCRCCFVQNIIGGTNWSTLGAGQNHIGAIRTDGTLWMWGFNFSGALGNGTTNAASSPVQVGTGTDWSTVTGGAQITAAIKTNGTLWMWGDAFNGVLGNNTTFTAFSSPVQTVAGGTNWKQISVGNSSNPAVAVKTDGTLWTWGYNKCGGLGIGSFIAIDGGRQSSPVQTVAGGTNWRFNSALNNDFKDFTASLFGESRHAIKSDGTLWTWGSNNNYELGLGDFNSRCSPTQVGTATNWQKVASGQDHVLAIKSDGTLWAWGNQGGGQLGNGNSAEFPSISTPIQIGANTNWCTISAGNGVSAGIKTDGTLWVWGSQGNYTLGIVGKNSVCSPVQTSVGGTTWCTVRIGACASHAIKTDGTLWSWGQSNSFQTGQGSTARVDAPTQVGTGNTWCQVHNNGFRSSAGIKTDGTLWAWGYTAPLFGGVIGLACACTPVQVGVNTNWRQAVLYGNYESVGAIMVKTDGTLWGSGLASFCGGSSPSLSYLSSPIQIGSSTTWRMVSQCMGAKCDGTMWTWGANYTGQLGIGATGIVLCNRSSPVQTAVGGTNWKQASSGACSFVAIKCDGTLWGAGYGVNIGCSPGVFSTPVQIGVCTDWNIVCAVPQGGAIALKTDGTLWGWSTNNNCNFTPFLPRHISGVCSPVQLAGFGNRTWCHIGTSYNFLPSAVDSNNNLVVWGLNCYGSGGFGISHQTIFQRCTEQDIEDVFVRREFFDQGNLWSTNICGGLHGDNTTVSKSSIVQTIAGGSNWKQVCFNALGGFNPTVAAIKSDGTLWVWGDNSCRQLGIDSFTTCRSSPVQTITGGNNWKQVAVGGSHVIAIKDDGSMWGWGANGCGQIGNGTTTSYVNTPVQIGISRDWWQVDSRPASNHAIKTDGTLWTWGSNIYGALGIPTYGVQNSPVQIGTCTGWINLGNNSQRNSGSAIRRISGGTAFTGGNYGALFTWGSNASGRLGVCDGVCGGRSSPVQVGTDCTWKQSSSSYDTSAAIKVDGTLWVWGSGSFGKLGTNNTIDRSSPVQTVAGGNDWKYVIANGGFAQMIATKTNGSLWGWGFVNRGDGTATITVSSPVQMLSGSTGWMQVSSFNNGFMAIKSST